MSGSQLVYSTDDGDRRRVTKAAAAAPGAELPSDGVVRVSREQGGRRGKTVTVVRGLPAADLSSTLTDLKRLCGSGGTVKNGALEIQGDHRERVAARLESRGHVVKLAGG
jgi:translation initiation factor 1